MTRPGRQRNARLIKSIRIFNSKGCLRIVDLEELVQLHQVNILDVHSAQVIDEDLVARQTGCLRSCPLKQEPRFDNSGIKLIRSMPYS